MKNKQLLILYIIMLVVGIGLLLSNIGSQQQPIPDQGNTDVPANIVKTEIVNVFVAKRDIAESSFLTEADYEMKTIEVLYNSRVDYIASNTANLKQAMAKYNIAAGTVLERSAVVFPNDLGFKKILRETGQYLYTIAVSDKELYLLDNLDVGSYIDIYLFYGTDERGANASAQYFISPPRLFNVSKMKPIIVRKQIITMDVMGKRLGILVSESDLKQLQALRSNASLLFFPTKYVEGEITKPVLFESEMNWPISTDDNILGREVRMLRGN